jgi:integrase/recombinase XerD
MRIIGVQINTCNQVYTEIIEDYILFMKQEKSIAETTINTRITNIRAFFNFCFEKGYIPPFSISLMRIQKKIKQTYSDKELETLLVKPDMSVTTFQEYRNWFVIVFFYDTGVRIKTLVNILIEDLLFDRNKIAIRTQKNKRVTYIHMSAMLKEYLQEYLSYRKRTARKPLVLQIKRRTIKSKRFAHCYEGIQ